LLDLLEPLLLLLTCEIIRSILLNDSLLKRGPTDLNLSVSDKRAAISLLGFKVRGIQMELAIKIIDSVHCPRVLTLALLVPLNTQPDVTTCFGVIDKLASITDTSKDCAQEYSLTQEMCIFRVRLNWAACFRLFNHYYCVIK
jgi:hypothetical protein